MAGLLILGLLCWKVVMLKAWQRASLAPSPAEGQWFRPSCATGWSSTEDEISSTGSPLAQDVRQSLGLHGQDA
jgi:hypothetical protein